MAKKIMSLTSEQTARFPEFIRKWTEIGLSTKPADRERAERAIHGLYALAKLKEPKVIWLPCPISAALSVVCYAAIIQHRLVATEGAPKDVAVDSAVGSAVDSAVDSAGWSFFGGSIWNSGYSAWADYFSEVCAVAIDRNFLEMTASAGFYWTLDGVCFVSERPSEIHLDQGGQLHADDGMAIRYAGTGWGLYSRHGYRIPDDHSWIITDKARITAEAIMAEPNAEIRRIMCEVTAFDPIRAIAEVVSEDVDGNGHPRRLMTANIKGDVIRIVEVQNGSLEPDGSRRKFLLGALAGRTPHEVIAASYGINPKLYVEAVRT